MIVDAIVIHIIINIINIMIIIIIIIMMMMMMIIVIIIIIIKALYGGKSFGLGPVGDASWGEVAVAESVLL